MGFVGRTRELHALEDELAKVRRTGSGSFVWLTGRRRVGKSTLVERFLETADAPSAFFRAPRRGPDEALRRFASTLAESSLSVAPAVGEGLAPDSWVAALRLAAQGATKSRPAILVIDELPYLIEQDPGFDADLQEAWDRHLQGAPVLLIAVGSDAAMMAALLDAGHALHGRPTRELPVHPFSPAELAELTGMGPAAALDAYMVVGGFPTLATTWRDGWSRPRYLAAALADSYTHFVVNGERILGGELAGHEQARLVLEAVGHGERTYTAIRSASGVTSDTSLSNALKLLDLKRLLASASPYAAPPSRKSRRYTVADPYLRFWLRFVGGSIDELDRGRSDLVLDRVERGWPAYRGRAIEPLARAAVERLLPDPRFGAARYVGGFWTRSNDVEVDLVGADAPDPRAVAFVGSIKWRERKRFDRSDTRELVRQRAAVPGAEDALLVGVSRAGFARDHGLDVALTPADLLDAWR
ncbi:MAG: AAA family ATPase [Solirubrobacterales bacterium]|nr:AAA family ATPase [Solirubrobacterales bacterium]